MTSLIFLSYLFLGFSLLCLLFAGHTLIKMMSITKKVDNVKNREIYNIHHDAFFFGIVFAMMFGVLSIVPLEESTLDTKSMLTLLCMILSIALIMFMDRRVMTRLNYILIGTSILTFAVGCGFQFI